MGGRLASHGRLRRMAGCVATEIAVHTNFNIFKISAICLFEILPTTGPTIHSNCAQITTVNGFVPVLTSSVTTLVAASRRLCFAVKNVRSDSGFGARTKAVGCFACGPLGGGAEARVLRAVLPLHGAHVLLSENSLRSHSMRVLVKVGFFAGRKVCLGATTELDTALHDCCCRIPRGATCTDTSPLLHAINQWEGSAFLTHFGCASAGFRRAPLTTTDHSVTPEYRLFVFALRFFYPSRPGCAAKLCIISCLPRRWRGSSPCARWSRCPTW